MKSNFEGHNKRSSGNVHAYASVYGDSCLNGLNQIDWHYVSPPSSLPVPDQTHSAFTS